MISLLLVGLSSRHVELAAECIQARKLFLRRSNWQEEENFSI